MNKIIGIFDSGIGGRSIEKEIKKLIPQAKTVYYADTKNFPYGTKTPSQIRKIAKENVELLLKQKANLVVVACNTATVHAIRYLRKSFPDTPFVGVEPAVKPAGEISEKGIIILSSPRATKSKQLSFLIKKYVRGVKIYNIGSLELVNAIENKFSDKKVNIVLNSIFSKEVLKNSDVLVLGCTHFPLIKSKIQRFVGKKIKVIDSGKAVAKRVKSLL